MADTAKAVGGGKMGVAEKLEAASKLPPEPTISWHVVDIETGYASQAEIEKQINDWKPPANIKDAEKIDAKRREFEFSVKVRSSLTDDAPIICMSFETSDGVCAVLSAMPEINLDSPIDGFSLLQFRSEKELLKEYSEYLASLLVESGGLIIAGHNILGFDLPKIRNRMIRNGLKIPPVLLPYQKGISVYDTMRRAADFGCDLQRDKGAFISFDRLANSLGIDGHKSILSGAEIPANHEKAMQLIAGGAKEAADDLITEIIIYSALDAQKEALAFRLMSGI